MNNAYAQKDTTKRDTIKKEYYEENQAKSDYYKRKEKYDYLTRAKIEELSMFKIGLATAPFQFVERNGFLGLQIGYEKKLRKDFSLIGNISAVIVPLPSNEEVINFSIAGRYYYNIIERIWEGKGANNLSANYFSLQLGSYSVLYNGPFYISKRPQVEALYGMQRRLGRLCFIDANFGAAIGPDSQPELVFNLNFGLGL